MKNLKALRKQKGMSTEALAAKIGISVRRLKSWEYGEREPSFRFVIALADVLECTVDELIRPKKDGDGNDGADRSEPGDCDL